MKKLDDVPKKQIFNVPEGYFEKLPGIIQSRVAEHQTAGESVSVWRYAPRYAMAIVLVAAITVFWFQRSGNPETTESIIASIETADLVAYIDDADLTTDELMDDVTFHQEDAEGIEDAVYSLGLDENNFDEIIDEMN
ncbi:MAG TPA: hypothetical protein VK666_17480 [Chryseolinea sp.]|nr:hypothetical protein [Chryseolinea sp.]